MRWPWKSRERETRSASYGDEVVSMLLQRAGSATFADTLQTLALETAAGAVGRAFASAQVEGPLGPELEAHLEHIGRGFVRRGESLLVPGPDGFHRAAAWDVTGGASWTYAVTVSQPDGQATFELPGSRVLHLRAAEARSTPWKGRGPLQVGDTGAKLLSGLETALANEANGPHGSILPVAVNPTEDGNGDSNLDPIRDAIRNLCGRVFLTESQRSGWGDPASGASGRDDWQPRRLGADPPESLVNLMVEHRRAALAACGVPPEILGGSDGAARREAWRQFLHGTLAPFGYIVEREVATKFGTDIRINWDRLRASDIQGRARAYGSLVKAEMDPAKAAALVGF